MRSEPTMSPAATRCCPAGQPECAADVYRQAGITDPRRQIDVVEMYVPFSWYEPMWLENLASPSEGEGWKHGRGGRHRA
jgi:acetyl-CoA C-acetyltransferase